ncbi:hypothetical protein M409DRAFT_66597 [Zasmidium cellare ATCC 36951]|uniref:Uncharacterized protein n=1 Tax=Zasmidium cellare ATCC 36951 TaxID=1080233 RepID=A0A6A6CHQ8_ZASCE|nr:uncharacterized protein M409DRAFT_66597 [Zasmidium cellare ATCC 36951]KAF2166581.1 hypothetical protein M409DRAFT_66597 [Zasmidium cellare ATCC 36951]
MSQNPKAKLFNNGTNFTPTIHKDTYAYIDPTQLDLSGRAVFITGASKGIGKETAISYAKAGASYIAIAARSGMDELEGSMIKAAKEAGRNEPKVLKLVLDVTSEESVQKAAESTEREFGRLDILVNNAGYLEPFVPITESKVEEWWKVWEINIKGPYLVTRALLPLLLKTSDSLRTILNVSSIGAQLIGAGASGYQTSKLALLRFGEFLNSDYKDQGVLSFGIHPGGVPTELALGMPKQFQGGLIDTPELAADSMVWLTAERREWLAGRYVSVNWDMKEFLDKRAKIEEQNLLKVRMDVGMD